MFLQQSKMTCVDESLLQQWSEVNYEKRPSPGIILSVDENDLEVQVSILQRQLEVL